MRKILLIIGFVVTAALVEGIAFYFSSRVPAGVEEAGVPVVDKEVTTFDEMMESAANYREERKFGAAYGFIRLAIDNAKLPEQRVEAGYEMGTLLYDDYSNGGDSDLDSASLYLQAAYAGTDDVEQKQKIGEVLLSVLEDAGEKEKFMSYLDRMLAANFSLEHQTELWNRKFSYLMNQPEGWQALNAALADAENIPQQDESWYELIKDIRLKAKEKLLTDDNWFGPYAETQGFANQEIARRDLFDEVRTELSEIYENSEWEKQANTLLRLAKAYVAVDDYDQSHDYLQMFMDMNPTADLSEALILYSHISRIRGDMEKITELAKSIIRRFDFNKYTRNEVLNVVELLEDYGLYDEALDLLEGCFSVSDVLTKDYAQLIHRAAVLEERLGHRTSALEYMRQLTELKADSQFEEAYSELIDLNMKRSDYESVENLIYLFIDRLMPESDHYKNTLFSLFDAKFWLDRPIIEQLFVGSAAIQAAPEDLRTASVELRMAGYIENMKLHDLAISYYNRIGLLNFLQGDNADAASSQNISEQAMLGKARCLKKQEDWSAADHLYRELCNRTKSPMVKSEAAVGWGELALQFNQRKEAERRFNLAYSQLLSEVDQVRYMLGKAKIDGEDKLGDPDQIDDSVRLLDNLPLEEQKQATISFFNETFDYFYDKADDRSMLRLIDIACQNDLADWLPIQSYMLRLYEERFDHENIGGLGTSLRDKDDVAGASIVELAQVADRVERLADTVARYKRKAIQ